MHKIIIGRPILKILEGVPQNEAINLRIGKKYILVSYTRLSNTFVEPDLEDDPLDELAQPNLENEAQDFIKEEDTQTPIELDVSKEPKPSPIELKPLPPRLKYAYLFGNRETPVIISDLLSEIETQQLITVLEKTLCSPWLFTPRFERD